MMTFRSIVASNVTSQKVKQRFPHASSSPHTPGISFIDTDSDDDEPQLHTDAEPHQPPRIAQWRSNLVALSQSDNLYFAAYQDKIHVTIPRGLKQTIHGKPDLIIDLPRSKDGTLVGGFIDRMHGHNVNHIIVGNLGVLEIVLMACDDGDVIAYYTHTIQAAIKSPGNQPIRPFFHENVGISAWGLAVHSKSRLIAVSSNSREVVIFRFGCAGTGISANIFEAEDLVDGFSGHIEFTESTQTLFPTIGDTDVTIRFYNFRKILKLGPEGHNIPSIDFSNDSNGDARSILATDIAGNLWIMDVWRPQWIKRIPSMQKLSIRGNGQMGWGALALPLHAFQQTATPEEALGLEACQLGTTVSKSALGGPRNERYFDITNTLSNVDVDDKSPYHPLHGYGIGGPETTPTLPDSGSESTGLGSLIRSESLTRSERMAPKIVPPQASHDTSKLFFKALINTPLDSPINMSEDGKRANFKLPGEFPNAMSGLVEKRLKILEVGDEVHPERTPESSLYRLQDKCAILRTYTDDIELIPPTETMPRTICRKPLKQDLPVIIAHQLNYERLIFQFLIAELGLVVIGSQVGRVVLISLTRPEDSFSQNGPVTMFRIDHILPTYTHEIQGFRPAVPLLGLAVSPLQGQQMKERKRWRLIMHFYDHSILTYELSRDGDQLVVL